MTDFYNAIYDDMKKSGITKIMFNPLFERYRSEFQDDYNLFKDFLVYLEENKKIRIVRFENEPDLFLSVEIL